MIVFKTENNKKPVILTIFNFLPGYFSKSIEDTEKVTYDKFVWNNKIFHKDVFQILKNNIFSYFFYPQLSDAITYKSPNADPAETTYGHPPDP